MTSTATPRSCSSPPTARCTNKNTKGKAQPRAYRFKLTMVRKGDKWLTSDLQILG